MATNAMRAPTPYRFTRDEYYRKFWVVNLPDRKIEVFADPAPQNQRYRQHQTLLSGSTLYLLNRGGVAVVDLLP